ncbi:metal ABC transporter substrate-binding protein [Paenibacillus pinistramenti]|uniref:metal ABC transporter substrate-binding protein n=1 Tax=Paenibacillus pinistramenti TaxID=1768003 RepID=UPI001108B041|nr:metal ABC transporter substrate-binding protein [Paenibacillus pinistramenti]
MTFGRNKTVTALIISFALAVSGCSTGKDTSFSDQPGTLKVEVSFYPMYEFTKKVAGELADVHTLIPAGVEPHDWEPTPRDIGSIEEADVLVYNGAGLEGWVDQVVDALDSDKLVTIEASSGIDLINGFKEEEEGEAADPREEGGEDPHVWLSPVQAVKEVRNIQEGLSKAAPQYAAQFKSNADTYIAQLEELDQEIKQELTGVKRKDFITQHSAFGYFARDYGLEQIPIAGLSPDQEPSASSMADIVKFAKEHDTRTIFFETLVSSKVAQTVADEIGATTAVLNPIEGLTDEELADHLDYVSVMRQNLKSLAAALNE